VSAWRHHSSGWFLACLVVRGFTVAAFEASILRRRPTIARVGHIQNATDLRVGSSVASDAGERTHGAIAILFGIFRIAAAADVIAPTQLAGRDKSRLAVVSCSLRLVIIFDRRRFPISRARHAQGTRFSIHSNRRINPRPRLSQPRVHRRTQAL